jgi:hypothetical protein
MVLVEAAMGISASLFFKKQAKKVAGLLDRRRAVCLIN